MAGQHAFAVDSVALRSSEILTTIALIECVKDEEQEEQFYG